MSDSEHWAIFARGGIWCTFETCEFAVRRARNEVTEGGNDVVIYRAVAVVRRDPPVEQPIVVVHIPEKP